MNSRIGVTVDLLKEGDHEEQFLVVLLAHEWFYRDTIVKLKCKRQDRIVYQYNVFDISIPDDPQVFHIYAIDRIDTVLTIQSGFDNLSILIYEIETSVRIILSACCKYTYFVVLR